MMDDMYRKVSRRKISMLLAGGLAATPSSAQSKKPSGTIHQELDFKIPPERIYKALLDEEQFAAFTHAPAEIRPQEGGTFRLFGGQVEGRIVELKPNQRIVEAWRPASWPPGDYSIVKFEFIPSGAGTHLVFDHFGFTDEKLENLTAGWQEHYWNPIRAYLER